PGPRSDHRQVEGREPLQGPDPARPRGATAVLPQRLRRHAARSRRFLRQPFRDQLHRAGEVGPGGVPHVAVTDYFCSSASRARFVKLGPQFGIAVLPEVDAVRVRTGRECTGPRSGPRPWYTPGSCRWIRWASGELPPPVSTGASRTTRSSRGSARRSTPSPAWRWSSPARWG